MRILGLDLGTKTLGVSISDNLGIIASKYKTIEFASEDYIDALYKLKSIVDEFNIKTVVLGLPKNMNNTLGFAAKRSLDFKELLEEKLRLNVIMQDERLSSKEANDIMIKNNTSRQKRKKTVDSLAAVIILQSYLDSRKEV